MNQCIEQYGIAVFTLVLVAILIVFVSPLGMKIKNATTEKVTTTEEIGSDEIVEILRPEEPAAAVDEVYCIYYDDGEMTISQNEIEPEAGRTVIDKNFYKAPSNCTTDMKTVRFVGAVKPKSCQNWFKGCKELKEIKNLQNLYTSEVKYMNYMFFACNSLTSLDVSKFDTSKVTNMDNMFFSCTHLTSLNLSGWDTSKLNSLYNIFYYCYELKTVTATQTVKDKILSTHDNQYIPSGLTWIIK